MNDGESRRRSERFVAELAVHVDKLPGAQRLGVQVEADVDGEAAFVNARLLAGAGAVGAAAGWTGTWFW